MRSGVVADNHHTGRLTCSYGATSIAVTPEGSNVMERVEAAGIVGGGVLAEDVRPQDWERKIAEGTERLYQARLVRRLLLVWAYPGNLVLLVLASLALALLDSPWPGVV